MMSESNPLHLDRGQDELAKRFEMKELSVFYDLYNNTKPHHQAFTAFARDPRCA